MKSKDFLLVQDGPDFRKILGVVRDTSIRGDQLRIMTARELGVAPDTITVMPAVVARTQKPTRTSAARIATLMDVYERAKRCEDCDPAEDVVAFLNIYAALRGAGAPLPMDEVKAIDAFINSHSYDSDTLTAEAEDTGCGGAA